MEYRQGWYSVHVTANGRDATEDDLNRAVVDVELLASELPHGSGIDGDWGVNINRDGSLRVSSEYHDMNENGYYTCWRPFSFSIRKVRGEYLERQELTGPCANQVQLIGSTGETYITDVRAVSDLAYMLQETIDYALRNVVTGLSYNRITTT